MSNDFHSYPIEFISKNDYMVWHVCTQTSSKGKVELKDDTQTYFSIEKGNTRADLQHLIQGGSFYTGGAHLRLEVTIYNTTSKQDASVTSAGINTRSGENVGITYNICVEDAVDMDYNDYYINLAAWRKQG